MNTVTQIDAIRGKNPQTIFINEVGLYSLVMSSKFPEAHKFKCCGLSGFTFY